MKNDSGAVKTAHFLVVGILATFDCTHILERKGVRLFPGVEIE